MNTQSLTTLFSSMLERQIESGMVGEIQADRLAEIVASKGDLSLDERRTLLFSPIARDQYMDAREVARLEIVATLERHAIELKIIPLAAATESDTHVFSCSGYRVTLYNQKLSNSPWIVLIQLDAAFMKFINPNTIIQLVDEGGQEWAKGNPDENGELLVSWPDDSINFLERARQFSLNLAVV